MDTFGDRLKSEREDRGLSIQAVAEVLRVDHEPLDRLSSATTSKRCPTRP